MASERMIECEWCGDLVSLREAVSDADLDFCGESCIEDWRADVEQSDE